jgi:hypothetical protein
MRTVLSERVERARESTGPYASTHGELYGRFRLVTNDRVFLLALVSAGSDEIPWQHVSVTVHESNYARPARRCPTWDEMCWVKSLFFDDDEVVVQYHPAKRDYVNVHPFCLHLWKPNAEALPTPPPIAVGPHLGNA